MGVEIGFRVYKKMYRGNGDLNLVEVENLKDCGIDIDKDDTWMCGRNSITGSWYEFFTFGMDNIVVPVFDKEADGYSESLCSDETGEAVYYTRKYKYIDFKEFCTAVENAMNEEYQRILDEVRSAQKEIIRKQKRIDTLRKYQMQCTEENEYAFNRWTDEIRDLILTIEDLEEFCSNAFSVDSDDTNYGVIQFMRKILKAMEKVNNMKDYVVVPFYSN